MALAKKSVFMLAAVSALGFSVAQAAVTRASGEGVGVGQAGAKCAVSVNRDRTAGEYVVTRLVEDNGSCTCFVNTGPTNQGGGAESSLTQLLADKTCDNAPPAVKQNAGGGGLGAGGAIAGGAAVAGGLAAGLAGGSDSPGG